MDQKRVLVCGSNYGTAYIRALSERPDAYQLAGLLARGSKRSRTVAQKHNVPLYSTVAEIPEPVDIACAAMGSPAFDIVLNLLSCGIHVLLEHPVRPRELQEATGAAAAHQVRLHVQTLYPSLEAPRDFIQACRAHSIGESRALIELLVTDRSLFASLDILRQAIGALEPFDCTLASPDERDPFDTFHGASGEVPLVVRVQRSRLPNGRMLNDGGPEYLVDCRITVSFDDGTLTLMSVAGPVIWNARYRKTAHPDNPAWLTLRPASTTYGSLMRQQTKANVDAIDGLSAHAAGGPRPATQEPAHLLEVARIWERFCDQLARRHVPVDG